VKRFALLFLASCASMAPAYERPAAPIRNALPGGEGTAPLPALDQFVQHPPLRQLMTQALSSNRDLRRAVENIESARALYGVQRGALYPQVDAVATINRARQVTGIPGLEAFTSTTGQILGQASWEIDVFGRIKSLTNAREQQVLSTLELARAARVTLLGEIATAYVTLATDRKRLAIAKETMELGKKVMDLSDKLVGGGTSNRSDFYQAKTVYEQARADVAQLTAAIAQDTNALDLLVGGPVGDLAPELPANAEWFAEVPVGMSSAVLLDRPDVRAAEHDLMAANANIGAARAAFFPNLSLTASGGLASAALKTLFTSPVWVYSLIPSLAMPLFRGGANKANLAYTESQKRVFIAAYEGSIQRAFREVADALAVKATLAEQLSAQQALVEAAQKSFEISQARYQAGIDQFITTLVSQRALYAAQNSLVSVQQAAMVNRIALYRALGGGVDKR
jgi:multidrug efflux system outer membrane protein